MKLGRLLKLIIILLIVLVGVKLIPVFLGPYVDTFYNPDSILIEKKKENINAKNKEERDWIGESLDMGKKLSDAKDERYKEIDGEFVPEEDPHDEY